MVCFYCRFFFVRIARKDTAAADAVDGFLGRSVPFGEMPGQRHGGAWPHVSWSRTSSHSLSKPLSRSLIADPKGWERDVSGGSSYTVSDRAALQCFTLAAPALVNGLQPASRQPHEAVLRLLRGCLQAVWSGG